MYENDYSDTLRSCRKCEDIALRATSSLREVPSQLVGGDGKRFAGGGLLNFAPAYGNVLSSSESEKEPLDVMKIGELRSNVLSKTR